MILYVYKIINLANGKIYVGKHSAKKIPNSYMGSGVLIKKAIKKYGLHNFKKEIICICENESELNKQEIHWISQLCIFGKDYNLTKGGDGVLGFIPTEEQRAKRRLNTLNYHHNNPNARIRLSEMAKLRVGDKNPFYGKKLSPIHIANLKIAREKSLLDNGHYLAKKVKCVETGVVYSSATEAAKDCNLKYPTTILKAIKGTRKSAGGFTWSYL
jgi:group I intron endonuclease